jgi:nucleotide-binding universal stress UspA family protein
MTITNPKHIICAVRGGPESRHTVTKAINMALDSDAQLTFLHVADAEFLAPATIAPLSVVYHELIEMSKFAMLILCDRAQRRGVTRVDYKVVEGRIRQQLHQFAIDTHAELMVMGRPIRSPGSNVFKPDLFDTFTANLAKEANIEILHVTPENHTGD